MSNDIFLHLIAGAALFALTQNFDIVYFAAIVKEAVWDLTANLNNSAIFEPLKDISVTMLGALVIFSIIKLIKLTYPAR